MTLRTDSTCLLCGAQGTSLYRFPTFGVSLCEPCDHAFNVYPEVREMTHLFAGQYVDSISAGGLLQRYIAWRRFRTVPREARTLLELGCGVGYFLEVASKSLEVTGLDNSIPVLEKAKELAPKAQLVQDLPEQCFDVICGFHMFEHVPNPIEYASMLKGHLNSGGLLYLRVPNRVSALADRQGRAFYLEGHCSHFSAASLATVLRRAGFKDIRMGSDRIPGLWLEHFLAPLISAGSRAVAPVNQAYGQNRKTLGLFVKHAILATFHHVECLSDIALAPFLRGMIRRGRGEELVVTAR